MKKIFKLISLPLMLIMVFALFVSTAHATEEKIIKNEKPSEYTFLGKEQPKWVLFKQSNNYIAIWTPTEEHKDANYYFIKASGVTGSGSLDGFNGILQFFHGDNTTTYDLNNIGTYAVVQREDGWYAYSSQGKISIVIYSEGEKNSQIYPGTLKVKATAKLYTTVETILKNWQREVTPYQEWTQYISEPYGSVTATNAGNSALLKRDKNNSPEKKGNEDIIVPNSNHFTYATLNLAELQAGKVYTLDLVVGNKIDVVGKATVKLVNGNLVIETNDTYKAKFGAIAFTNLKGVPNNGNIHSMNKEKDMQNLGAVVGRFDHDNKTVIPCPTAATIYLYIHFDTIQFDLGEFLTKEWTVEGEYELKLEKVIKSKVIKSILKNVLTYEVFNAEGDVVSNLNELIPDMYTIKYYIDGNVVFEEEVEVLSNQTTRTSFVEKYFEQADPKIIEKTLTDIVKPLVTSKKIVVRK